MADSLVFLFTVSTFMSVVCLLLVFLVSWQYESLFLGLATRINNQEKTIIEFKGAGNCVNRSDRPGSMKGVSFTRWGHGECSGMTELVYSGVIVNVLNDATVPQCFPLNPTYHSELNRIQRREPMQKTHEGNNSIPCAVCHSTRHSTMLMQPARQTCTTGWSEMYKGLLVTNKASLLCIDIDSVKESHPGKINDYHFVRASCDLLPCPPYVDNSNLTCVVCIK